MAPKVVRALLGMSAVDTPLILVAFAAGEGSAVCHDVLLCMSTMAPRSLDPCISSLSMSSTKQAGRGASSCWLGARFTIRCMPTFYYGQGLIHCCTGVGPSAC